MVGPYKLSLQAAVQYIPRNMHTVFALLCFIVVIHWLIFPYPSGLLHWHCGNLTIAPVPAKQPWWIWINISRGFIMNDCITTTKQSTTKPCAYFLGYTVEHQGSYMHYGHYTTSASCCVEHSITMTTELWNAISITHDVSAHGFCFKNKKTELTINRIPAVYKIYILNSG